MFEVGTVLLNKYRIDRVLGRGGMGMVALAQHQQLHQPVAIKFLLPEMLAHPEVVQRFLREAQASVRLKSEHVCRVIDVGTLESGAPYMVMEYLDGLDLDALLQRQGRLHPGVAVDFVLQGCEALAEAHALGIVHRDLKPSNFFMTRRPDGSALIKVLDFGISKTATQLEENLTSTQSILGTPAYMSPEQLKASKYVDARADLWSLGVVLYELLVGQRPFTANAFSELVLKVAMDPAPLPAVALPPGLAEIVMRCLQKEPEARYRDVAELAAQLAPYAQTPAIAASAVERTGRILHGAPGGAGNLMSERPGSIPPASYAAPSTFGSASGERIRATAASGAPAKKKTGLIAGLAAAAVAGGIAIVAITSGDAGGPTSSPASAPAANQPSPSTPAPAPASNAPASNAPAAAPNAAEAPAAPASAPSGNPVEQKTAEPAPAPEAERASTAAAAIANGSASSEDDKARAEAERKKERARQKRRASKKTGTTERTDDDILGSRQ